MTTRLQRSLAILLVFLLVVMIASSAPAPPVASPPAEKAQEAMPDGLMSVLLEASSQPFSLGVDGYRAHSSGLDFALDSTGLQANLGGFVLRLALRAVGREGQMAPLPDPQIAQADGRLEYDRGVLTEWYSDTALGVEQGFTIHQPPLGAGPLIVHLDLSTDLIGEADADGRGLSFATPDGQTLRYDHLRAWDADGVALEARLGYTPGHVQLQVKDQAATYPITIDPLFYHEQQVIASDGRGGDSFGYSVALWDDTALVGAPYDNIDPSGYQGSVYVFLRNGITWTEQAHLVASDGEAYDNFGRAVALWGDTALVGALGRGIVYVFTRSGTTWSEEAKLIGSDGAESGSFGYSVALHDDTALVGVPFDTIDANGAQGSAYVFARNGTTWSEQAHLTASDGVADDYFGHSVAVWGNRALVGAPDDTVHGNADQGSVYVFTRSGTTWSEQAHLIGSQSADSSMFGWSVALWDDTALAGTYGENAAYVFTSSGTTWSEQARVTGSASGQWSYFGNSVALWDDTALIGAAYDDNSWTQDWGSAYVFVRSESTWNQEGYLIASDSHAYDCFGFSVSLWGDTALVGAPFDDVDIQGNQGSAYFYEPFPVVESVTRATPSPTNAPSVGFVVTFSKEVTDVGIDDFLPSITGSISGVTVSGVSGSGTTYTITVSTGIGSGTLRLDVPFGTTIADLGGNPLSDLPYISGESYVVDKTAPVVLSITRAEPNPVYASPVSFYVTFSEDVTGVDVADFVSSITGSISGATTTGVSGSGATYTVAVSVFSGGGTLRLAIPASATITDPAGNSLSNLPYTSGEAYTFQYVTYLPLMLRTVP
jgi:hypothetical protein